MIIGEYNMDKLQKLVMSLGEDVILRELSISKSNLLYLIQAGQLEEDLQIKVLEQLNNRVISLTKKSSLKSKKRRGSKGKVNSKSSLMYREKINLERSKPSGQRVLDNSSCYNFEKNVKNKDDCNSVCQVLLANTLKNNSKLDLLFAFPEKLNLILKQSALRFSNESEIKLFLLTHWKDFVSLSAGLDRELFLAYLDQYIRVYLKAKSVPKHFSFKDNCSIQREGESIWISGVGHLIVSDPNLL